MTFPDPNINDAEAFNFIARLEDRYNQGDLQANHPVRETRVDPLGYGRWASAYLVKRANGQNHEDATRMVLAEINAVLHPTLPKPPPPTSPPSVPRPTDGLPRANHAMFFGYYLDGGAYGYFRNEVASYTNITNVWSYFNLDDLAAQRADFEDAARSNKPIVWAPNQNPMDAVVTPAFLASLDIAQDYWSKISYVFIDEPSLTQAELEMYLSAYRLAERSRNLARKPVIVNFTNDQVQSLDPVLRARGIDIVGFEVYMGGSSGSWNPATQNDPNIAATCLTQVRQFKAVVGARPMVITIQGYDRNKLWTNRASLVAIQTAPYLAAYDDPNVIGLMVFSYGRAGGSRDLGQEITNEHRRIWKAITP